MRNGKWKMGKGKENRKRGKKEMVREKGRTSGKGRGKKEKN